MNVCLLVCESYGKLCSRSMKWNNFTNSGSQMSAAGVNSLPHLLCPLVTGSLLLHKDFPTSAPVSCTRERTCDTVSLLWENAWSCLPSMGEPVILSPLYEKTCDQVSPLWKNMWSHLPCMGEHMIMSSLYGRTCDPVFPLWENLWSHLLCIGEHVISSPLYGRPVIKSPSLGKEHVMPSPFYGRDNPWSSLIP